MKTPHRTALLAATTIALLAGAASAYAAPSPTASGHRPSVAGEASATAYGWSLTPTGTTERFRGLAPVSSEVAARARMLGGDTGRVLHLESGIVELRDVLAASIASQAFSSSWL